MEVAVNPRIFGMGMQNILGCFVQGCQKMGVLNFLAV